MASPYRRGKSKGPSTPEDDGIVGDLVRQFADPYAFYRELVQNAIDAGTTRVDVRIRPGSEGGVRITVRDDGEGMDPEVLEGKLLVLFRSGKEGQEGKIGKFGVGFVSVLAVKPSRVTVRTSRGGPTWTLHLFPDHTYELFEGDAKHPRGTSVILDVPGAELGEFVKRSHAALRTWCRHATLPIHFHAECDADHADRRIDEPLGLPEMQVTAAADEGDTRVVVGLPAEPTPFAGFYNRGLTLFETRQPFPGPLGALHFKVQAPDLEHTLSRDNVRRDAAFRRAMKLVERVVERELVPATLAALREAAEANEPARWGAIVDRCRDPRHPLAIPWSELPVRLLHPHGGVEVMTAARLGYFPKATLALARTELTQQLHAEADPVVDGKLGNGLRGGWESLAELLRIPAAHQTCTLVAPQEPSGVGAALLERLEAFLRAAHRRPDGLQLVRLHGAQASEVLVGGPPRTLPWVAHGPLRGKPFRFLARSGLLLNVTSQPVRDALELAEEDVELAAALLAREVLLRSEVMKDGRDRDLTEAALEAVLEVTP